MNPLAKLIGGTVLLIVGVTMGLSWLANESELNSQNASVKESNDSNPTSSLSEVLTPIQAISHVHGLAVDVADASRLYLATHEGLAVLKNDTELYRIGDNRSDLMGFSVHPKDAKMFFSSGHPPTGGNLGFQKSTDGGMTWKKISGGVRGTADFHAMAVSLVNPDIVYGLDEGRLQRSMDGGKKWEMVKNTLPQVISLVSCTQNESMVYAATVNGLYRSVDQGETWENLSENLSGAAVASVAMSPEDSMKLISFSEKLGMARSDDGGVTWQKMEGALNGEIVMNLAIDGGNPEIVYAATRGNNLYKSVDNGVTWNKIR